jgi:aspartyl protease family protein
MGEGADQAVHVLYLIGALVLIGSAFAVRRIPLGSAVKMFAGWVLIFAAAFIIFTFKDEFSRLGDRLLLAAAAARWSRRARRDACGSRPTAISGWRPSSTARTVRFLVDSGATTTSISSATARRVGHRAERRLSGHGEDRQRHRVGAARPRRVAARRQYRAHATSRSHLEAFGDMNVIGMNFLSSLKSWGVEGRTLILRS